MQIIIAIADADTAEVMLAIAAANGWPREKTADTVERVTNYMSKTVADWTKRGQETITREQTETATLEAVKQKVKITIK